VRRARAAIAARMKIASSLRGVVSRVLLCGVLNMFIGMKLMAVGEVCVMARFHEISRLRVVRCFFVVFGSLQEMACGLFVMIADRVRLH
jgi:hypothetical protein